MKIRLTMDVEFEDLPPDVRSELADGLVWGEDDSDDTELTPVPRASSMSEEEVKRAIHIFFDNLCDYEMQPRLWPKRDTFGYISSIEIVKYEPGH